MENITIFELRKKNGYQSIIISNPDDYIYSDFFKEKESIIEKIPHLIKVELLLKSGKDGRKGKLLKKGDLIGGYGLYAPIFTKDAQTIMSKLIDNYGEFIELKDHFGTAFFAFHTMNFSNAFDRNNSDIEYFSDGCISDINKYFFHIEKLADTTIFKIPEFPYRTLVNNKFVDFVIKNNLKGFEFNPLWSSNSYSLLDKIET